MGQSYSFKGEKYLPKSEETTMGHMKIVRQGIHVTKNLKNLEMLIEYGIWYPLSWKWRNSKTKMYQIKQSDFWINLKV